MENKYLNWDEIIEYPKIKEMVTLTDAQRKGYAFELLVCNLCRCMFDTIIYHTPFVKDCGRDAEFLTGDKKIWIECKNLERTLGTHIVAKTLVMAMLREVNKIYIFSQSPVSELMLNEVLEFSDKTDIEVIVIASLSLVELILKFRYDQRLEFNKFFPSGLLCPLSLNNVLFDCYSYTDKKTYYNSDIIQLNVVIKSFEIFCEREKKFFVELNKEEFASAGIEVIGEFHRDFTLKYGEVKKIDFILRIGKYKEKLTIPSVKVSDFQNATNTQQFDIKCSRLIHSNLIGESLNFVYKLGLNEHPARFLLIEGKSGVGKSRLINEACISFLNLGYNTRTVDLEYSSAVDSIKKIISVLYNLPYVTIFAEDIINTDNEVYHILYDAHYDFEKNYRRIADFIYQKAVTKKCFIAIDNLQDADALFINVLNELISKAFNEPMELNTTTFAITVNTERLISGEVATLIRRLEGISLKHKVQSFEKQVNNSDINLSLQFIYSCLNIKNSFNQDELLMDLAKCCSFTPLDIEQTLQYMCEKEFFEIIDNALLIRETVKFNEIIKSAQAIGKILDKRYQLLLEKENENELIDIISLLCFFDMIPKFLYVLFFPGSSIIDDLITSGFVDEKDGNYIFYHRKISAYFKEKCQVNVDTLLTLPKSAATRIYNNITCGQDFYIAKFDSDAKNFNSADALYCLEEFKNSETKLLNVRFLLFMCRLVALKDFFTIKDKLFIVSEVISVFEKKYGIERTIKIFESYIKDFRMNYKACLKVDTECYVNLIRKYANKFILLHKNQLAYNLLNETLVQVEKMYPAGQLSIKSILNNRLSVCAGSLNRPNEALRCAKVGIKYALRCKDTHNIIENLADLGYCYYKSGKKRKCIKIWNKMYAIHKIWINDKDCDEDERKFCVYKCECNKALVNLIKQIRKNSEKSTRTLKNMFTKIERPFYKIKAGHLICADSIIRMANYNQKIDGDFFKILEQTAELTRDYNDIRSIYKTDYLYANYYYICGDMDNAKEYYKKTFINLEKAIGDEMAIGSYIFLFYDLFNKIKELTGSFPVFASKITEKHYIEQIKQKTPPVGLLTDRHKRLTFPIF